MGSFLDENLKSPVGATWSWWEPGFSKHPVPAASSVPFSITQAVFRYLFF